MTRLSRQRGFHAMVSWLEQMDPTKVHEGSDYTANQRFAKWLGEFPTEQFEISAANLNITPNSQHISVFAFASLRHFL